MSRARFKKVISYNKFHRVDITKGSLKVTTLLKDKEGEWQAGYGVINKEQTHLYLNDWKPSNQPFYRYKLTKDVIGGLQVEGYPVYFRVLFETF